VAELFGLVFSILLLLVVFLPLLTFLRVARVSRELEELRARVLQLERRTAVQAPAATPAVMTPEAATPAVVPLEVPPAAAEPEPPRIAEEPPPQAAHQAPGVVEADDLETRIGGRGLLYTGVFVLLLGISFFLRYAFENNWIDERGRSIAGALAGLALVVVGVRLAGSGLERFGHALVGTGFAVFYLVAYAALNFYALVTPTTAFAAMIATTIAAAAVAHRQRSQPLASIAVGGGFLTPALVGGNHDAQLTLFSYDALLVMGTLALSLYHRWLGLNALSYAGTLITVLAWTSRYYDDDLWLRTLLFLTLFCVCFLLILRATRYSSGRRLRALRAFLLTAPALYHVGAVIITAAHPPAIHVYLIAFTVAGLWLTVEPYRPLLRLLVLCAALIPMFGDLTLPSGSSWLMPNIVTIAAVAILHVMALVDRVGRQAQPLGRADLLALHAAGIGSFALLYDTLQPVLPWFRGALAAVLAFATAALARWFKSRDDVAALNATVLTFTLITIGIAVQFDGPVVIMGWAAEGAAAVWVGARTGSLLFQAGGVGLWLLAVLQLFETFSETTAGFTALANARTGATFVVVAAGYVIAARLLGTALATNTRAIAGVLVITSAATLGWITAEIQSFWEVRADTAQAHLYEQVMLSLAWGAYGATLVALGMARAYRTLRYIGIAVIVGTSFKVFFYDLWELGGIYRVIGFMTFGLLLVLVSYLYQQRRAAKHRATAPPQDASSPSPTRSTSAGDDVAGS
jgi:uncharacterized membrane protein